MLKSREFFSDKLLTRAGIMMSFTGEVVALCEAAVSYEMLLNFPGLQIYIDPIYDHAADKQEPLITNKSWEKAIGITLKPWRINASIF